MGPRAVSPCRVSLSSRGWPEHCGANIGGAGRGVRTDPSPLSESTGTRVEPESEAAGQPWRCAGRVRSRFRVPALPADSLPRLRGPSSRTHDGEGRFHPVDLLSGTVGRTRRPCSSYGASCPELSLAHQLPMQLKAGEGGSFLGRGAVTRTLQVRDCDDKLSPSDLCSLSTNSAPVCSGRLVPMAWSGECSVLLAFPLLQQSCWGTPSLGVALHL